MRFSKKIIGLILLFSFFALAGTAMAASTSTFAWQTPWPKSPLGTDITAGDNPSLAVAIKYLYEWGIGLGGLAVFIALIMAGFEYITSIGNPSKMQDAFNRIRDAVIGLVILLSSYAILSLVGINLTAMKVDMFQGEFESRSGCKSTPDAIEAPDCCNDEKGVPIPGCDAHYFTCLGWDPDLKMEGSCLPHTNRNDCGSAEVYFETAGSPLVISTLDKQYTIDSDKHIKSVVFKDNNTPASVCYDPTAEPGSEASNTKNPVCNCGLQLFTKTLTTGGGFFSNPCENADIYAAPNNDSLKVYIKAKNVVCVSLIKS